MSLLVRTSCQFTKLSGIPLKLAELYFFIGQMKRPNVYKKRKKNKSRSLNFESFLSLSLVVDGK